MSILKIDKQTDTIYQSFIEKYNNTIGSIPTGSTYNYLNNTLSLQTYSGYSVNMILNFNKLIQLLFTTI